MEGPSAVVDRRREPAPGCARRRRRPHRRGVAPSGSTRTGSRGSRAISPCTSIISSSNRPRSARSSLSRRSPPTATTNPGRRLTLQASRRRRRLIGGGSGTLTAFARSWSARRRCRGRSPHQTRGPTRRRSGRHLVDVLRAVAVVPSKSSRYLGEASDASTPRRRRSSAGRSPGSARRRLPVGAA